MMMITRIIIKFKPRLHSYRNFSSSSISKLGTILPITSEEIILDRKPDKILISTDSALTKKLDNHGNHMKGLDDDGEVKGLYDCGFSAIIRDRLTGDLISWATGALKSVKGNHSTVTEAMAINSGLRRAIDLGYGGCHIILMSDSADAIWHARRSHLKPPESLCNFYADLEKLKPQFSSKIKFEFRDERIHFAVDTLSRFEHARDTRLIGKFKKQIEKEKKWFPWESQSN